jgi:hypothetical protein
VLQHWLEHEGRPDLEELFIAAREALATGFASSRSHPVEQAECGRAGRRGGG